MKCFIGLFHVVSVGPMCDVQTGSAENVNFTRNVYAKANNFRSCFFNRPEHTTANGFTWNKDTMECSEVYNAKEINTAEDCCESCMFEGKLTQIRK